MNFNNNIFQLSNFNFAYEEEFNFLGREAIHVYQQFKREAELLKVIWDHAKNHLSDGAIICNQFKQRFRSLIREEQYYSLQFKKIKTFKTDQEVIYNNALKEIAIFEKELKNLEKVFAEGKSNQQIIRILKEKREIPEEETPTQDDNIAAPENIELPEIISKRHPNSFMNRTADKLLLLGGEQAVRILRELSTQGERFENLWIKIQEAFKRDQEVNLECKQLFQQIDNSSKTFMQKWRDLIANNGIFFSDFDMKLAMSIERDIIKFESQLQELREFIWPSNPEKNEVQELQETETKELQEAETNEILDSEVSSQNDNSSTIEVEDTVLPEEETVIHVTVTPPENIKSPMEWIEKIEKDHEGLKQLKEELLVNDMNRLQEVVSKNLQVESTISEASVKKIETFAFEITKLVLAQDLMDLREQLLSAVGEDLTSEMMQNWKIIGRDVQVGEAALTEERKKNIVAYATQVKNRLAFQDIVNDLKRLENGEVLKLAANEELIKQYFPNLIQGLQDKNLPAQKQWEYKKRYHKTLNTAMILSMVRDRGTFIGRTKEAQFIEYLGYNKREYLDRRKIQETMSVILDEILQQKHLLQSKSAKQLRTEIEGRAFDERLKLANVETTDLEFVKQVIKESIELDRILKKDLQKKSSLMVNEKTFPHPQFFRQLKRQENCSKAGALSTFLKDYIKEAKSLKSIAEWKKGLKKLNEEYSTISKDATIASTMMKDWSSQLHSMMTWYDKHKDNLVVELVQGLDDPQTILLEGCCWAITKRLIETIVKNPKCSDERLQADVVLPIDRYFQAYYSNEFQLSTQKSTKMDLPYTQPLSSVREYKLFEMNFRFDDSMKKLFKDNVKKELNNAQNFSAGVVRLSIAGLNWGHSTFIQIDPENNNFRIFDPNVGLLRLKIERKNDETMETSEELIERLLDGYLDLLETFYPSVNLVRGRMPVFDWDED